MAWWLLQSRVGAAEGWIVEHDGARRETAMGPKSPWPDWVVAPPGSRLRIQSYFGAAPGYAAQGMGEARLAGGVNAEVASLIALLQSRGWTVETARVEGAEPTLPPTPVSFCLVTAAMGKERTASYVFQEAPETNIVRIHWFEGEAPAAFRQPSSLC